MINPMTAINILTVHNKDRGELFRLMLRLKYDVSSCFFIYLQTKTGKN